MEYYRQHHVRFGFGSGAITPAVKYLLIINGCIFFLQSFVGINLISWFGLHQPGSVVRHFYLWQLVSYMFLHVDFFHIFFNMLMLWMFGCEVERKWGTKEFLTYYLVCGVGAGVFHLVLSHSSVIGASGAIYGVLIAFVLLYPDRQLMFFPFFISLKAKYWAMIFAGISLLMGLFAQDKLAHFAHLGGMIVGFIYIKFDWKIFLSKYVYKKKMERKHKTIVQRKQKALQLRKEIDRILDKINEVGYENLSEQDRRILKQASDFLAQENRDTEN